MTNEMCTGLQPIVKWPGGKEKELKYIVPNIPVFKRYIEPFVGGGSVFMAVRANEYLINDFSEELIRLYRYISNCDTEFYHYASMIDSSWLNSESFFALNSNMLVEYYLQYRNEVIDKDKLKELIHVFCKENKEPIMNIIDEEIGSLPCVLQKEMEVNMFRKMTRMKDLEGKYHELPYADLLDNIETSIKSAVYMNYRNLYNNADVMSCNKTLQCALFLFIRNYAYSGMFRYSSKGEFNVPYGGIAYNKKTMAKKLEYYRSEALRDHFKCAMFYNSDFEKFLYEVKPTCEDFIFLDPPYDSEFCTYAQNVFSKDDQVRLANYMINKCEAKWMLVIKNTEFIFQLYNKPGINIRSFEKKYLVSFMNRNDKNVTHLLITNY